MPSTQSFKGRHLHFRDLDVLPFVQLLLEEARTRLMVHYALDRYAGRSDTVGLAPTTRRSAPREESPT